MFIITVNGMEYKVRYGMNSFVDSDVMDRAKAVINILDGDSEGEDNSVRMVKDLFACTRDLFYIGFQKHNPIATPQEVGDLLDDYIDEAPEGEKRGILQLFNMVTEELLHQGFLEDLMGTIEETQKEAQKETQETKKPKKVK